MSPPFSHPLRVRYNECDMQGIVFNGHYLTYFDIAVTELWREAMGGWQAVNAEGVEAVVGEATVRYLAPLRFDQEFDVSVAVGRIGDTSLLLELAVERDGTRVAEGELRYVFIELKGQSKARIPDPIREALAPYSIAA